MGKRTKITEENFALAKSLLAHNMSQVETAKILGVSDATVCLLNKASDYHDYGRVVAEVNRKRDEQRAAKKAATQQAVTAPQTATTPAPVTEVRPVVIAPSTRGSVSDYQISRLMELMNEQNELLKLISNKLAFVVEQLA